MISGTYNNPTRERFRARVARQSAERDAKLLASASKRIVAEQDPAHGLTSVDPTGFLAVGMLSYDPRTDTLERAA
jgi:hypothetical protein